MQVRVSGPLQAADPLKLRHRATAARPAHVHLGQRLLQPGERLEGARLAAVDAAHDDQVLGQDAGGAEDLVEAAGDHFALLSF